MNHYGHHPLILSAAAVLPIAGPCIMQGAVAITGNTITAVGPAADLRRNYAGTREESYPNCVLMPGLINAHTHLELSFLRNKFSPTNFVDWVIQLIRQIPSDAQTLGQLIPAAVRSGMTESLRFGVTTVGDITRQTQLTRAVLRDGPLRAVSFGEIQALGARRNQLTERLAVARDASQISPTLSIGLSPHAPYSVEGPALQQIVQAAAPHNLPLCMHLAELQEEQEFLATLGGNLRQIWNAVGVADLLLDQLIPLFDGGPIPWAKHWGLLDSEPRPSGGYAPLSHNDHSENTLPPRHASVAQFATEACETKTDNNANKTHPKNHLPPLLAHVNYATDAELDFLSQSRASVAYCPRTRQFFGHDRITPHRWQDMLARHINVCLATDSLASNPDLSPLGEAQTLLKLFSNTPPESILPLITANAAKALHLDHLIGILEPGKQADLIALPFPYPFPATPSEIAGILITTAPLPTAVWIAGEKYLL